MTAATARRVWEVQHRAVYTTTMTEVLQLWWLWWWCLWWVCLAAARVAAPPAPAAPAAASSQGQCEVLNLSQQSIYSLPTNLTVKPTAPVWLLDFVLQEGEAPPAACVRLKQEQYTLKLLLYKGECRDHTLINYTSPDTTLVDNTMLNYLMTHTWTSLALDVENNAVLVTRPGADPITLKADDTMSLPCDSLHVTAAKSVEAAVGCRVNCPHYKHASEGPDKETTVRNSQQENFIFYFRPGKMFDKLQYEITCITILGLKIFVFITDILQPDHLQRGPWHLVELHHLDGETEVHLDYKFLKKEKVPKDCTFTEHTIRLVGESFFSFSCNPSSGAVQWVEDDRWESPRSTTQYSGMTLGATVGVMLLAGAFLVAVVYGMVVEVKKVQRAKDKALFKI